jgi:hypothetical protein
MLDPGQPHPLSAEQRIERPPEPALLPVLFPKR